LYYWKRTARAYTTHSKNYINNNNKHKRKLEENAKDIKLLIKPILMSRYVKKKTLLMQYYIVLLSYIVSTLYMICIILDMVKI